MNFKKLLYIAGAITLTSCNAFLDKVPDNRVDPQTPTQLLEMLVDGYSSANYGKLCEFSSDNIIDNNSPDEKGVRYDLNTYNNSVIDHEIYAFEDAKSEMQQDSPSAVWSSAYYAIAVANHVLSKIEQFEKEGRVFDEEDQAKIKAAQAEAYLIRAYNHFVLVNIFAQNYRGPELSKQDLGIPYVTEPETEVLVNYARLSVAEVYDKIEQDLLLGLPNVTDIYYEKSRYHFNKKAAYAFAARFYLFKRDYEKVEQYASVALGSSPETQMRTYWSVNYSNVDSQIMSYYSSESQNNYLLIPTYSIIRRSIAAGTRYSLNRDAAKATIYGPGPTWSRYSFHPCYNGKLYINGKSEYGLYFMKLGELFEYTDKVSGIGYVHNMRAEFTAEETILARAEARIYLNNIPGAVSDLKIWEEARHNTPVAYEFDVLTEDLIRSWYSKENDPGYGIINDLHIDEICPTEKYSLSDEKLPFINCVLHFRRIETVFDGYRWFDLKRYGIEFSHKIGRTRVETMTKLDPRRALQIPAEVISAGMEPNNRFSLSSGISLSKVAVPLKENVTVIK